MRSFAQTLDLVDDEQHIAEYVAWHTRVWPEVTAGLRAIGIQRMKIFRHGTRLFMYCEAPDDFDPARDYATYARDPRPREWNELMQRYQRQVPGATRKSWWTPMNEVFDLESSGS